MYLEAQLQGTLTPWIMLRRVDFNKQSAQFQVFLSNKTCVPWSPVARNANTMNHADFGRQNQISDVVIR